MLTGKLVRVRHARNRIVPIYLDPADPHWLSVAEALLLVYREAVGRTRGEIDAELVDVVGEGPRSLIPQGLAKLCEDRCEFEVASDQPPDALREVVFRIAAEHRSEAARTRSPFDRAAVLAAATAELKLDPDSLERSLFADLKDEQRVLSFADLTPSQLLHRYNIALGQAVLLRCTSLQVRIWGETPARFRQLFRAVKFHRLIGTIRESPGNSYTLTLDGPLSLFSSTQKYGLQLALFLPTLLHCKAFELHADVRWGADRKEKEFVLSANDGLKSQSPDFGVYTPPELKLFAESFAEKVKDWSIASDPHPVSLGDGLWVPDFQLVHERTGLEVFIEVFGFWRRGDIEQHYQRLQQKMPGRFVLCVSEQYRTDASSEAGFGSEVIRFKRTLLPEEVARTAARVAGLSG